MKLEVIRAKCLDCCDGSAHEVKFCTAYGCPLWPHRMNQGAETLKQKRPWLADPELHAILAQGQGWRELYHETGREEYRTQALEKLAVLARSTPQIRNYKEGMICGTPEQ